MFVVRCLSLVVGCSKYLNCVSLCVVAFCFIICVVPFFVVGCVSLGVARRLLVVVSCSLFGSVCCVYFGVVVCRDVLFVVRSSLFFV